MPGRDPIALTVMQNALERISDGMALTVARTARSNVVRIGLDFSVGIHDSVGELTGQGFCMPVHVGGMAPALQACLKRLGEDVNPGDILVNNDPYQGGSHLPDVFTFKPVFVQDEILAFMCVMTHLPDIGGRVPGGNATDNTEIYQEGFRIPPMKLYDRGSPNQTLLELIERNVRISDQVMGDIEATFAALRFGEREFVRLIEEIGADTVKAQMQELLDYTEELTRAAISRLPDSIASFTDWIDDDGFGNGPLPIAATVRKESDTIDIDFSGSSPQVKGSINLPLNSVEGITYAGVKTLLSAFVSHIPNTSGMFRPVNVRVPEGSILNPISPAPVAARALVMRRLNHALWGAFGQMLPDIVPACPGGSEWGCAMSGYYEDEESAHRRRWVYMDFGNEIASGAYPDRDGVEGQNAGLTNSANVPVEIVEREFPIEIEAYGLLPDSEGAGQFRGGVGMFREFRYLADDVTVQVRSDRQTRSPYGLHEGEPPRPSAVLVKRTGDEDWQRMTSKIVLNMNRGDVLRGEWPGGGGWGSPLARDAQAVLDDVVEEKISISRAKQVYGVVIDDGRLAIDSEATAKLRQTLARAPAGSSVEVDAG